MRHIGFLPAGFLARVLRPPRSARNRSESMATPPPAGRRHPWPAPASPIDLDAIAANWRALDALSAPSVETAAVVKADAYGLGAAAVGPALARAGARSFFVALAEEGAAPARRRSAPARRSTSSPA